jgi:hypothetical protein
MFRGIKSKHSVNIELYKGVFIARGDSHKCINLATSSPLLTHSSTGLTSRTPSHLNLTNFHNKLFFNHNLNAKSKTCIYVI